MDAVQVANTAFVVDLFKKLADKDKTGNLIFAPLCTSTSLALVYKAAKGDTATQMKQVGFCLKSWCHTITHKLSYADNCMLSPWQADVFLFTGME